MDKGADLILPVFILQKCIINAGQKSEPINYIFQIVIFLNIKEKKKYKIRNLHLQSEAESGIPF